MNASSLRLALDRRSFLEGAGRLAAGAALVAAPLAATATAAADESLAKPTKKLRVAAINSIYRLRSHAYHICGRLIHGYQRNGFHHRPDLQLVRMFNDQYPDDDLGREYGRRYGVEVCDTVEQALGGKNSLDVDAVLLIIEHGDYPVNEWKQVLYPRFEMFQRIVEVFKASGRTAPVFVDKHLSYDHQHAKQMVDWSRELGFGLMAGSSLPVTWRIPEIEPPLETPFTEGLVAFGFDRGPAEIYLFHALEVLQCMLERRRGGETGVRSVELIQGDAVWRAFDSGRLSKRLLQAALDKSPSNNVGAVRENVSKPAAIVVEYLDGTRGSVVNLIEQVSDFSFAAARKGTDEPIATNFYLPIPPGARFFDPLVWNIEKFSHAGKPPYPVERTLLTSTLLDLALHPRNPSALQIRYQPPAETGFFRGPVP
ncbi:MAG: hypothetical protein U0939_20635 [Pirellulales bacterium]